MKSFVAMAVLMAVAATSVFTQGGKWFIEPGVSFTRVDGMDLRVAFRDPDLQETIGDVISLENDYKTSLEVSGGYIFSDESRLTVSFVEHKREPGLYYDLGVGSLELWDLHIAPFYGGFDFDRVWASNEFRLTMFDVDYTFPVVKTSKWLFEMLVGLRYTNLENTLNVLYDRGNLAVDVDKSFSSEMYGPKIGLTVKTDPDKKLGFYTAAAIAILVGNTNTSTFQIDDGGNIVANFGQFHVFDVQKMAEIELGFTYAFLENITARLAYRAFVWDSAISQIWFPDATYTTLYNVNEYNLVMSSIGLSFTITFG
ncbi:MAG TPA: Lpg1974 family pore-forming outer membrane protein [Elusimicrobiales bacterium]|nr:Lpg1974 family pore-forming outer membrane protein [Elusimicrobiales bacterium]